MRVNGHYLIEKKQSTVVQTENSQILTTINIKMRVIDDNFVKEVEIFKENQDDSELSIETDMTNEERKIFDENWVTMWKPKIGDDGKIAFH